MLAPGPMKSQKRAFKADTATTLYRLADDLWHSLSWMLSIGPANRLLLAGRLNPTNEAIATPWHATYAAASSLVELA